MSKRRKGNSIAGAFIAHPIALRESSAWRALPDNARRVLDRLELEHCRHGGAANGALTCTYSDFIAAGIRRQSVALAIRQCVALGFLEITRRGRRSGQEYRTPSLYRLTYILGWNRSPAPTHEWQSFGTDEAAKAARDLARTETAKARSAWTAANAESVEKQKAGVKSGTGQGSKPALPEAQPKGQNRHSYARVKVDPPIYNLGRGGAAKDRPPLKPGARAPRRKPAARPAKSAAPEKLGPICGGESSWL